MVRRRRVAVHPEHAPGAGVEGDDVVGALRQVHDAVDDERRCLPRPEDRCLVDPLKLQVADVGCGHVVELAVALAEVGARVGQPIGRRLRGVAQALERHLRLRRHRTRHQSGHERRQPDPPYRLVGSHGLPRLRPRPASGRFAGVRFGTPVDGGAAPAPGASPHGLPRLRSRPASGRFAGVRVGNTGRRGARARAGRKPVRGTGRPGPRSGPRLRLSPCYGFSPSRTRGTPAGRPARLRRAGRRRPASATWSGPGTRAGPPCRTTAGARRRLGSARCRCPR